MTKDNILFGIVGLLAGLIIGFMFANSVNKQSMATMPAGQMVNGQQLPPGHPSVPGGGQQIDPNSPEIQTAVDKAKAEPTNFDAQVKAADATYQVRRYDDAIAFYKKAYELNAQAYDVIVQIGNASFDSDKYNEAEKYYLMALEKKPEDVSVRTDLGLVFMFREPADYDRAITEFKKSLEYNPSHPQTLQNLTVAYTKKADASNANATLARLEGIDNSNPAISRLRTEIDKLKAK